jgi:hypothetical protein
MTATERLTEVFDQSYRNGINSLTTLERELYLVQDFFLEIEMNGLSSYFYYRLRDVELIQETVNAMQHCRLLPLSKLLAEALQLFANYVDTDLVTTWNEVLRQYDPTSLLHTISDQIRALEDYGLADSKIAAM